MIPTLAYETRLWLAGHPHIAGIDEAGRGALAGPVVAGAVMLPTDAAHAGLWAAVRDSKQISPEQRDLLAAQIQAEALAWGVGQASAEEIDQMGIAPATRLAMQRAIDELTPRPTYLLIDWVKLPQVNIHQESFPKGDQRSVSIAAASILAKTHRDALLVALDGEYPQYGFAQHKGYATATHLTALQEHGPSPVHRHTFAPIRKDERLV
jgi:ribonuclease HII